MSEATSTVIPDVPMTAEEIEQGALSGTIVPVTRQIALPDRSEWRVLAGMANELAESGVLGRHLNGRPKAVMAAILKGRELGLPPMEALSSIYIIEGVPCLSSHLMLALVRRQGHRVWFPHTDGTSATIAAQRRDWDGTLGPVESLTWTIEMARQAGLYPQKDNWEHYPEAMLRARATTALCRMTFSDVLAGAAYSPEEIGARVSAGGEVISLPTRREAEKAMRGVRDLDGQQEPPPPQSRVQVSDDPADDLHADTVEDEVEEPLDREALWVELCAQAGIVGQTLRRYTTRWAAAHRKNIEQASTQELAEFVYGRRGYVQSYLSEHPEAADAEPVQAECPPEPGVEEKDDEVDEAPAEAEDDAVAVVTAGAPVTVHGFIYADDVDTCAECGMFADADVHRVEDGTLL